MKRTNGSSRIVQCLNHLLDEFISRVEMAEERFSEAGDTHIGRNDRI